MQSTHTNQHKNTVVSELKDLISKSKSIAVVDYTGLKVSQITELRRQVKKAGGKLVVTKNTLFKVARGTDDSKVEGTAAYVFSLTDEVSAVKAVADFAKKNQLPKFKMGILDGKNLSASEISQLANLPDKPTMIAKMLGTVKAPLFNLTYNLNWNISKLVRTLNAVYESKKS